MANKNIVILTGTPKKTANNYYLIRNVPVYCEKELQEDTEVTLFGYLYSDEISEDVTCEACKQDYPVLFNVSYVIADSIQQYAGSIDINSVPDNLYNQCIIIGKVVQYKVFEDADRAYYQSRVSLKNNHNASKHTYVTATSLSHYVAEKGNNIYAAGRLRAKCYQKKCICPHCGHINTEQNISVTLNINDMELF